jgi:hypothetical protein
MNVRVILVPIGLAVMAVAGAALAQPAHVAPPGPPPAADHSLAVMNSGGAVVSAVYVAPSGSLDFSDDLLGKQVASVGKTVHVKVKDPGGSCVFDVQFLMADGTTVTKKAVNVCQSDSYTFTR